MLTSEYSRKDATAHFRGIKWMENVVQHTIFAILPCGINTKG